MGVDGNEGGNSALRSRNVRVPAARRFRRAGCTSGNPLEERPQSLDPCEGTRGGAQALDLTAFCWGVVVVVAALVVALVVAYKGFVMLLL